MRCSTIYAAEFEKQWPITSKTYSEELTKGICLYADSKHRWKFHRSRDETYDRTDLEDIEYKDWMETIRSAF